MSRWRCRRPLRLGRRMARVLSLRQVVQLPGPEDLEMIVDWQLPSAVERRGTTLAR